MSDNKDKKIRVSDSLLAALKKYRSEESLRLGGMNRDATLGDLLERAWAVFVGRPEPPPPPEDKTITQLREILEGDHELCEQARHFVKTIHGVLRLRKESGKMP